MIPFGSIRGNGADLAVHLGNTEDNEYVEIAEMRGVIADDLPGGFSEADAKINALTNMDKGYYSLALNPWVPWTREMYFEYRDRAEIELGLVGHDRFTVFHIKQGKDGNLREHCHVVWNRTDVQNMRRVDIKFDRLKLMSLTREFAHEKGLQLPKGYYKIDDNHEQTSLYEKVKENQTGISKEQHKSVVTDLWRTSDSPKAFIAALEDRGYMLATGRRPYLLVDTFGKMHALPRLIDDKQVRTADVEAYLKKDFPPESLSTVEEARAVAVQHEESRKRIEFSQRLAEQKEILERDQEMRRESLQDEITAKQAYHHREAGKLSNIHGDKHYAHKLNSAKADMEINFRRAANAPTGLAGFLSRITGMDVIRSKLHAHQDRKREAAQEQVRFEIEEKNRIERLGQRHEHQLEMIEMRRQENEQKKNFEREQRSIVMAQEREKVAYYSKGHEHMPSVHLALTPRGRMAVPAKAKRRFYAPTVNDPNVKSTDQGKKSTGKIEGHEPVKTLPPIADDFYKATDPWYEQGGSSDEHSNSDVFSPSSEQDKDKGRGR